jgi:ubiquinone/menaquinone biosynthesis C-methylase UbiE
VTGLDVSEAMLEEAKRLDRDAGVPVSYLVARAEATGLPNNSFEVVTAGQCWHWFDHSKAGEEVMRVLVPGGGLLICTSIRSRCPVI